MKAKPHATHSLRNQIQEIFPSIGTTKSAELSEVVVAGQSVVAVSLNVNGAQVTAEWHAASEQEMLDFDIEVDVRQLFRLRGHAAAEKIVIVARLDDDGAIEPVTETQ